MILIPKNWAEFQHYKDRAPPWIKLHKKLLDDRVYQSLPLASRALAPMLWLLASESKDGSFDGTHEELAFRLRTSLKDIVAGLQPLIDKGFFVVAQHDSGVLADCLRVAVPEAEGETEKRERTDQSIPSKYPESFLQAWAEYPKRPGASKADSLKAWNARVNAGADPAAMLAGVQRYAAFCIASSTAPNFIKQPATFFGPGEHYLSDWTPSTAPMGGGTIHDRRAATHAGLTQRANHANSDSRTIDAEAHVVG